MFAVLEVPDLTIAFGFYVVFLLSVTAHEAAHALAASEARRPHRLPRRTGDPDPVLHIRQSLSAWWCCRSSPSSSQWPSASRTRPTTPWSAWHPKRAAWMALAGPAANLVFGAMAFVGMKVGSMGAFEAGLMGPLRCPGPMSSAGRGRGRPLAGDLLEPAPRPEPAAVHLQPVPRPADGWERRAALGRPRWTHAIRALFAEPWAPPWA